MPLQESFINSNNYSRNSNNSSNNLNNYSVNLNNLSSRSISNYIKSNLNLQPYNKVNTFTQNRNIYNYSYK